MMEKDLLNNEQELLRKITAKDKTVFSEVFHKYYPILMHFAQRFVSFEVAQDIISETFIKLWESQISFAADAQVYQWLKAAVRNAALNQIRNNKRLNTKQREMIAQLEDYYEVGFYEANVAAELFSKIRTAIELLPPQQQKIIKMYFLNGKNNAAIAQELDISVQAVKNQKVTALKVLRKTFNTEDFIFCLLITLNTAFK